LRKSRFCRILLTNGHTDGETDKPYRCVKALLAAESGALSKLMQIDCGIKQQAVKIGLIPLSPFCLYSLLGTRPRIPKGFFDGRKSLAKQSV